MAGESRCHGGPSKKERDREGQGRGSDTISLGAFALATWPTGRSWFIVVPDSFWDDEKLTRDGLEVNKILLVFLLLANREPYVSGRRARLANHGTERQDNTLSMKATETRSPN
jgi:hypothetical protein